MQYDLLSGTTLKTGSTHGAGAGVSTTKGTTDGAGLDRDDVVVVLLLKLDNILDGLDGGVVVVLVHLLVNGGLHILVLGAVDGLVDDGRGDLLVDGGVVVTRLGPGDCQF